MNIVIGLGNFGCRTLKALKNTNISDATLIACDTDIRQKELQETDGIVTIVRETTEELVGEATRLLSPTIGCGSSVFILAGLGGRCGTDTIRPLIRKLKATGADVSAIVSTPFKMEGVMRRKIADDALWKTEALATRTYLIENEKILQQYAGRTLVDTYAALDAIVCETIKNCSQTPVEQRPKGTVKLL